MAGFVLKKGCAKLTVRLTPNKPTRRWRAFAAAILDSPDRGP
jgi:hypothetical protein